LDDDDPSAEATTEGGGPSGVGLHGDNSRPDLEEWASNGAGTGTHVDDECARGDAGLSDEQLGPASIEGVPAPRRWFRHGDGP
jgi:hypothetical protein